MKSHLILLLLFFNAISTANAQFAETVFRNGKIYTVNEQQPWAEAVAIKDGSFIKVGSDDDVRSLIGDDTDVVDLRGNMVMPGILDLHSHPVHYTLVWHDELEPQATWGPEDDTRRGQGICHCGP